MGIDHALVYHVCGYSYHHTIGIPVEYNDHLSNHTWSQPAMAIVMQALSCTSCHKAINTIHHMPWVNSVSDVNTIVGTSLIVLNLPSKSKLKSRNIMLWPTKHHITPVGFTPWRKLLRHTFSDSNYQLPRKLWKFRKSHQNEWLFHSDYFMSIDGELIFHRIDTTTWDRHLRQTHWHQTYNTESLTLYEKPVTPLKHASICTTKGDHKVLCTLTQLCCIYSFFWYYHSSEAQTWFVHVLPELYHLTVTL